jgi:uncharacterized protein
MAMLGEDLQKFGIPWLYAPRQPAGLWLALGLWLVIVAAFFLLQAIGALVVVGLFFDGDFANEKLVIKGSIIGSLPAAFLAAWLVWRLSQVRGGIPREILALRKPDLTWLGWLVIVGGFLIGIYIVMMAVVTVFQIDIEQYMPGPDGESPATGSAGAMKEAMFDLANEPLLFWLAFPAIVIGAPLIEELIFRGYLFSALATSRAGLSGATIVTSSLWSLLHITEPWFSIGMIFIMGLVLSALLIRFGSLWITMACHTAWNGANMLTVFLALRP